MSVIPTTTCRRCHRSYSSLKGRCPYCGTRKEKAVRRTAPEADSSVRGTEASRRAAEAINWQVTIGGVLLVLVMLVTIVMVTSTIKQYVPADDSTEGGEVTGETADAAITPVPTASPEPTPTATPVTITSMAIYYNGVAYTDLTALVGDTMAFTCTVYPANVEVEITWSSSDESVATVDEEGNVTLVGTGSCTITAEAAGQTAECIVRGRSSW
ncbi:MAG: Ig-like domain-containing protein [Oscillospiraceae bacterium]|nr:Ig-like domain-containing protein [Oscillospiraceae bacterium]